MIRFHKRNRRRGMTVILVLGLLSLTLALSYAMLRTQVVSRQIQANTNGRNQARQAAMTGLMVGLRKMHEADWAGVDSVLMQSLDAGAAYTVSYATGDSTLTSTHPDYAKLPYRVTVTSTGTVSEAGTSRIVATHTASAVVEFVPRALSSQPANWASLQNYTVCQWDNNTAVTCELPVRIEGASLLQGPVELCEDYPPLQRPWHGRIDEVLIFNRGLTGAEVLTAATPTLLPDVLLPIAYAALSPAHWWRLNETSGATTAANSAGASAGTFAYGAASGATGLSVRCAQFDGHDDHIDLGKFNASGSAITLMAWVRPESWPGNGHARILSKATGPQDSQTYWMLSAVPSGGSQVLRLRVRAGGSTTTLVANSGALPLSQWTHVAGVYDGAAMILYVNGVEVGRTAKTGTLATSNDASVYIGECPPGSSCTRYLRDLEGMRAAGLGDNRPFTGPISLPTASTSTSNLERLQSQLILSLTNITASTAAPLALPSRPTTYQLYAGGKSYTVPTIASGAWTSDLLPSMQDNPLGIYHCSGPLELGAGVTVEGTVFTTGTQPDLRIVGNNVTVLPVSMPALYGSTTPIQLPAAIVADDIHVSAYQGVAISGVVYAADDFALLSGSQTASIDLQGRVLSKKLKLQARTEWSNVDTTTWEGEQADFVSQLGGVSPVAHFPLWMQQEQSLAYQPQLKLRPPTAAVAYHWQDWTQPIFVPHASDTGLLWQTIRIVDGQ